MDEDYGTDEPSPAIFVILLDIHTRLFFVGST